jgi:hypothetical protein
MIYAVCMVWASVLLIVFGVLSIRAIFTMVPKKGKHEDFAVLVSAIYTIGTIGTMIFIIITASGCSNYHPCVLSYFEKIFVPLSLSPIFFGPALVHFIMNYIRTHKELEERMAAAKAKWEKENEKKVDEILKRYGV